MNTTIRAFDTTGTIDERNRLILDQSLPLAKKSKVRVIILFPEESDIDEKEWLRAASANPVFDFLKNPEEDIYTHKDGKPFQDEG